MAIKGRGAGLNTDNRFEAHVYRPEAQDPEEFISPTTEVIEDHSRSIVTENSSPDVPFTYSVNPYRGCEHGCAYCYARPSHEYLGYSAGVDFETKILVKRHAAELLREHLIKKSWQPAVIAMSGITDCYQPLERKMEITRSCLAVLRDFMNPVSVITKNAMVTRDVDILGEMAHKTAAKVFLSITTLDHDLAGVLEPRTSRPAARLRAIEELAKAGIPVGVNVAPVILGLSDHEIPAILKAASDAGATMAGMIPLRLPLSVLPIFENWLSEHRPLRKEKVLSAIRDLRGGRLNDATFGSRMTGAGPRAEQLQQMFSIYRRKYNFPDQSTPLSTEHFRRPTDQLSLF